MHRGTATSAKYEIVVSDSRAAPSVFEASQITRRSKRQWLVLLCSYPRNIVTPEIAREKYAIQCASGAGVGISIKVILAPSG